MDEKTLNFLKGIIKSRLELAAAKTCQTFWKETEKLSCHLKNIFAEFVKRPEKGP